MSGNKGNNIENTESICPVCRIRIPAQIIEEDSSAYMVKECAQHGLFKAKVSQHAWYYRGLNALYDALFPGGHPFNERNIRTLQFYPTMDCNLRCPMCYSHTEGSGREYSLSQIRQMIKAIKGRKVISILGGEPTMREDIFEIIKMFDAAGHRVEVYTNGVRLQDERYTARLKKCGVGLVYVGLDSLSDRSVYQELRGADILTEKRRALENLKKNGLKTGIIQVVIKGMTERYLSEIIHYARSEMFIQKISMRGYSFLGRMGYSPEKEFCLDELVETIEKNTGGVITLEEFYIFQKIGYVVRALSHNVSQCYVSQHIFLPRGRRKRMRDLFPIQKFEKILRSFEEQVRAEPVKARALFMKEIARRMDKDLILLFTQWTGQRFMPGFGNRYYIPMEVTMFYTPFNLDIRKTNTRCCDAWLPSYIQGKYEDYCGFLSSHTPAAHANTLMADEDIVSK